MALHGNRATGTDGLCIEMYKHTMDIVLPYLHKLFNQIFDSGNFPAEWSESIITPIHKKGSKSDPNNYRAISLINSLSKVFTHILRRRLTVWCENNDIIDESQAGFRSQYSTVDNIFTLQGVIQKYLSKRKGRCYVFYIDFLKAFDGCIHGKLWACLSRNGIRGKFLRIFDSMYSQLKSCVKVDGFLTNFFDCNIGTRQGCVSSPIIFSLFINDLINFLKQKCGSGIYINDNVDDLYALMFADDVSSVADTVINLQRQIQILWYFEMVGL